MPPRAKICGVTTPADAAFAAEQGADAVGLNFYPKSPRWIHEEDAAVIVRELPFCAPFGVFVDAGSSAIRACVIGLGLRAAQTYREPPGYGFFPAAFVPAFRVRDAADLAAVRQFVLACPSKPAAVLIDSFVAGEMGGTGHRAPWHLLEGFDPGVPLILAGGLTPDNVTEAIRTVRPWGVDVASGVESSPGRKDPHKVRDFLQAVRAAG